MVSSFETLKLTRRRGFASDSKLRTQAEDAAESACRNIAEGFPCISHIEFARFLEISIRSLNELVDAFRGAELRGYVTTQDLAPVRALLRRLFPAIGRLRAYLRRTPDWKPGAQPRPDGQAPRTDKAKPPSHRQTKNHRTNNR